MLIVPLPWIAAELGWFVAENGRQPWTIDGVLPTFLSALERDGGQTSGSASRLRPVLSALAVVELFPDAQIHPARPGVRRRRPPAGPRPLPATANEGTNDIAFLDYPTLRVIWWLLLGVLLIGFAVMDGFDLGVGILLPFVARTDGERRVAINAVGPVWEGNQVWLILGAGAIFAAWPSIYAVAFSGFYLAMFVVLCALILRPVGFKYRSKLAGRALAGDLGLAAVRRRLRAGARLRRRRGQRAARRALPASTTTCA